MISSFSLDIILDVKNQIYSFFCVAAARTISSSWWDDLKDTASNWIDSSKRWLVDAGNFLLDAANAGLDFLILDDVKTIFDPRASDAEKGFAVLSLFLLERERKSVKKRMITFFYVSL